MNLLQSLLIGERKNNDNKYCVNNGVTASRCDLQYNGFKMTGIGLDSSLIETFGKKRIYFFCF